MNIRSTNTIIHIDSGIPEVIHFLIHFSMIKGIMQNENLFLFYWQPEFKGRPLPYF